MCTFFLSQKSCSIFSVVPRVLSSPFSIWSGRNWTAAYLCVAFPFSFCPTYTFARGENGNSSSWGPHADGHPRASIILLLGTRQKERTSLEAFPLLLYAMTFILLPWQSKKIHKLQLFSLELTSLKLISFVCLTSSRKLCLLHALSRGEATLLVLLIGLLHPLHRWDSVSKYSFMISANL